MVLVPLDMSPDDLRTLDELASNRPNLSVRTGATARDWFEVASAGLRDDHILLLEETDRVLPVVPIGPGSGGATPAGSSAGRASPLSPTRTAAPSGTPSPQP